MTPLHSDASDSELIDLVDRWAALMESEDYVAAFEFTDQDPELKWTPELIREVVKMYGDSKPDQRITVVGKPTDITQRKQVDRWPQNTQGEIGEIWYDLNIDGFTSDLTATFSVIQRETGLTIKLNDIHVM